VFCNPFYWTEIFQTTPVSRVPEVPAELGQTFAALKPWHEWTFCGSFTNLSQGEARPILTMLHKTDFLDQMW